MPKDGSDNLQLFINFKQNDNENFSISSGR